MLPDNFELTLDELARLMNEWRRRALCLTLPFWKCLTNTVGSR